MTAALDPVQAAADALRAQVAMLGKQLTDSYPPLRQQDGTKTLLTAQPGLLPSRDSVQSSNTYRRAAFGSHTSIHADRPTHSSSPAPAGTLRASLPAASTAQHLQQAGIPRPSIPIKGYSPASKPASNAFTYQQYALPGQMHHTYDASQPSYHTAQLPSQTMFAPGSFGPRAGSPTKHSNNFTAPYSNSQQPLASTWRASGYQCPANTMASAQIRHDILHTTPSRYIPSKHAYPGLAADTAAAGHMNSSSSASIPIAAVKEEARLRELLLEMRHDRRRLEDKLLNGDTQGIRAQEVRDELERQVAVLSHQRDTLECEMGGWLTSRDAALAADAEIISLREALLAEQANNTHLQSLRSEMEAKLLEVSQALESIQAQHTQATSVLTQERDSFAAKQKKLAAKLTSAESELTTAQNALEAARKEAQSYHASLTEIKASAEVVQRASSQMQSQMAAANKELENKVADLQKHLIHAQQDALHAGSTQQALQEAQQQLKESTSRCEFLRSEREKLVKLLQTEQAAAAELRKELEAAQAKAQAADSLVTETKAAGSQQAAALQREYEARLDAVTKQYEKQLTAAVKQVDSTAMSGEKLLAVQLGLRQERDALWSEREGLRDELADMQKERDELQSKIGVLRTEVKAAMDDVRADRDARLLAAAQDYESKLLQLRAQYETQNATMAADGGAQIAALTQVVDRLKSELVDAQRSAERHRSTVAHLKEQLAAALVVKDDLEREVSSERAYGEELSRIVTAIKKSNKEMLLH